MLPLMVVVPVTVVVGAVVVVAFVILVVAVEVRIAGVVPADVAVVMNAFAVAIVVWMQMAIMTTLAVCADQI